MQDMSRNNDDNDEETKNETPPEWDENEKTCQSEQGQKETYLRESSTKNAEMNIETSIKSTNGEQARKDWKRAAAAARKVVLTKKMMEKVNVGNKIGVRAEELEDDDEMSVIGLSVQRSLRAFGRADAAISRGEKFHTSAHLSSADGVDSKWLGSSTSTSVTERRMEGLKSVLDDEDVSEGSEGKLETPDAAKFVEEKSGNSQYSVRQPAFTCCRILDDEFRRVRSAFGISEAQYYASLALQSRRKKSDMYVIDSKDSSGKSTSFFFLSPGQTYILKSCTAKDFRTMKKILPKYRKHVESCRSSSISNNNKKAQKRSKSPPQRGKTSQTLLPRYLGLYTLQFADPSIPPVVVVAMSNFFAGMYQIHKKFDLKGSTHNRLASRKERAKKSPVYKDLDWINDRRQIKFETKHEMNHIREQLRLDSKFLRRRGLIDYSLLVGVHEIDKTHLDKYDSNQEVSGVVYNRSGDDYIYYFGIVDVLTPYGTKKRAETLFTGHLLLRDVSCQPPKRYQKRFIKFCDRFILAHGSSSSD